MSKHTIYSHTYKENSIELKKGVSNLTHISRRWEETGGVEENPCKAEHTELQY